MDQGFVFIIVGVLVASLYAAVQRGTFLGVCGVVIILFAPVFADWVSHQHSISEVWLGTFRLFGGCVFAWGLAEHLIAAIRPPHDEPK